MSFHIRPATPADTSAWLTMREQLGADWVIPGFDRQAVRFFETGVIDHLPHAVFIAEEGDRPVGLAEVSLRPFAEGCATSPVGFLEGWFVLPGHRGQGIGRALVEQSMRWAKSNGCTEFASDAETHNAQSHAAHRAMGFERVCEVVCFRRSID